MRESRFYSLNFKFQDHLGPLSCCEMCCKCTYNSTITKETSPFLLNIKLGITYKDTMMYILVVTFGLWIQEAVVGELCFSPYCGMFLCGKFGLLIFKDICCDKHQINRADGSSPAIRQMLGNLGIWMSRASGNGSCAYILVDGPSRINIEVHSAYWP